MTAVRSVLATFALASAFALPAAARADDIVGPPPPPRVVWVHIESTTKVYLLRHDTAQDDWVVECANPCDRDGLLDEEYRLKEISTSAETSSFRLNGRPGEVVTVGYERGSTVGPGLLLFFGLALIGAGSAGLAGLADESTRGTGLSGATDGLVTAGRVFMGVLLAAGVGLTAGGSVMLASAGPRATQPERRGAQPAPNAMIIPLALSF